VGKFISPVNDRLKQYMGGLQIISLGTPFSSQAYSGKFVPYEIKLRAQSQLMILRVANTNAASRYVLTGVYDTNLVLLQDLKLTAEPEILPNNDAYAKLTPTQTVQAYFDAQARFDWTEMRKFTSQNDVDESRRQVEAAQKSGVDFQKVMPVFKAIDAVKTPDQTAYFVTVSMTGADTKKHNLAVRNDNPTHRWQVDGGF
jgi:hypothetical protein